MQIALKIAARLDLGGGKARESGWSKTILEGALVKLLPWSLRFSLKGEKKKKNTTGNNRLCVKGVDYSSMIF